MKTDKLCLVAMFVWLASSLWATDKLNPTPVKVRTAADGLLHFVRSEAYRDMHPMFGQEKILAASRFANPQVVSSFPDDLYRDDSADASVMVLFYGPGWDKSDKTPVLFVHGAGDDAFRGWVHPTSLTTPETIPMGKEGLLLQFANAGYPTFAVNFSHNHGCNYRQAEQIRNAIYIIRHKTGAQKVHLIAHSKGNCSASIYVCGNNTVNPRYKDFLSPFAKDVDIYAQIAPGNKGIDVVFRYYASNLYVLQNKVPSPVCFQSALYYGAWQNFYEQDIFKANPGAHEAGNYFPGQCQIAYNLVDDGLDFTMYSYTPFDFNLTMKSCYYGGTTTVVSCYGIRHSMEEGDFTIERLHKAGIDPSVRLINVYGTDSVIQEVDFGWFKIPIGVSDYPSDGMVYVHSASYVKAFLSRGARLIGQKDFKKNHFAVAFHPEVSLWLLEKMAGSN